MRRRRYSISSIHTTLRQPTSSYMLRRLQSSLSRIGGSSIEAAGTGSRAVVADNTAVLNHSIRESPGSKATRPANHDLQPAGPAPRRTPRSLTASAHAVAEAVQRPTTRFVPAKSNEQLDLRADHSNDRRVRRCIHPGLQARRFRLSAMCPQTATPCAGWAGIRSASGRMPSCVTFLCGITNMVLRGCCRIVGMQLAR